ncbi:hypothetical protein GCM10010140_32320 [Streptosporangium pseudovulgare]|uniref:Uncharacterized protein n=1 Tax=Streptosporangium pseudovulgare TaxID=35765 RepID=A0ABQ2QVJ1_9ACTN|nr:hypothetical protein GCM10010140_32320 [Streptosporangium pseudovulgare]
MEVTTLPPPHSEVIRCWKPQVLRLSDTPQLSGRVIDQQASEVLGQACCRLPELQVPQAPLPVLLHGPQAVPQQNQETSPWTAARRSMGGSVGWLRVMRVLLGGWEAGGGVGAEGPDQVGVTSGRRGPDQAAQ